jgi:hypothetical protein
MVFFLEITNMQIFLEIFKIHRLVWIFLWNLVVLKCFINVLFKIITNLKFYKYFFIKVDLQKHFCIIGFCLVRQRNL